MSAQRKLNEEQNFGPLVDFACQLVSKEAGIILESKQKTMVETRIKKRMIDLSIETPFEYLSYIKRHFLDEKSELVSALTTHYTYFFREFQQVEAMLTYLPSVVRQAKKEGRNEIHVWSAACSRGQEVYTLAMFLDYHLKTIDPSMSYKIFGSDIDPNSVKIAQNAVYNKKELERAPLKYLGDHWAKGKGRIADFVKAKKSIREKCEFDVCNLIDIKLIKKKFDIIFVRNVLIYFKDQDVMKITSSLADHLHDGGYVVCGASESLLYKDNIVKRVSPHIYQKGGADMEAPAQPEVVPAVTQTPGKKLRVLCVDDSASVLKLLTKNT